MQLVSFFSLSEANKNPPANNPTTFGGTVNYALGSPPTAKIGYFGRMLVFRLYFVMKAKYFLKRLINSIIYGYK